MDPLKYGNLLHYNEAEKIYLVQITSMSIAKIIANESSNNVTIIFKGKPIITYIDTIFNNIILRTIGKNMYYYNQDGALDLVKVEKANRFIKKQKTSPTLSKKFLSLDLAAARLINNKHVP